MELFISAKLVQSHTNLKESAAYRKLAKVRKAYHIPKYGEVNVFLYCKFYRMDVDEFIRFIEEQEKRKK